MSFRGDPPKEHAHLVRLVEDDVHDAIGTFLECSGFALETAGDGKEALDRLREGLRPCSILLDLNMPRLSGVEFRRIQLADPALAPIPVVVLSAAGDPVRRTAHLGVDDVLTKPADLDTLAATIVRHCPRDVRRSA